VYIPQAALEVTAKDQNGNIIHTERRKYQNWNLWFEGRKEVALKLWDITATASVNLGLEPDKPDLKTHVVLLNDDVESVTIDAKFLFESAPDHWETIKTATTTLKVESSDKYFK
jgi:hypothetical protein